MTLLNWQKQFTNVEAVADRLDKRLQIGGAQNAFGKSVLNDGLLNNAGAQVEARINAALSRCYRLPFNLSSQITRGLLASIAEKGILAEILPPVFAADFGRETSLRFIMATEYAAELAAICPGGLLLPGELPLADPNTGTVNHTLVGKKKPLNDNYRAIEGEPHGRYGSQRRPDADSVIW